ncbi:MAG: MBL fold metallo-hydrolase, partial [Termitinemataceae bacterium]
MTDKRIRESGFSITFLGQNSYSIETERDSAAKGKPGYRIAIDPYLSDWCANRGKQLERTSKSRLYPPLISPENLEVDLVLLTHSHCDHADPETLAALAAKPSTRIIGPRDALTVARQAGIGEDRLQLIHPGEELIIDTGTHPGLRIRATFALPTDGSDLNHVGFLIGFADGSTFWNTGDTAWCDTLPILAAAEVRTAVQRWHTEGAHRLIDLEHEGATWEGPNQHGPDLMAVCINAGYGNLSHWDASRLAGAAQARYVIPAH